MPWPIKHGMTDTREYRAWVEVKRRCLSKNHKDYRRYGAKGVTVDPDFVSSFQAFLDEIGPAPTPKHTVDRIDTTKGYIKGNIRWATVWEQAANRRTSYIVTIDGVKYDGFAAAARSLGITPTTMRKRCMGYHDKRFNWYQPPHEGYSYEPRYSTA